MKKIKWINQNPGASRDEQGYWESEDKRFSISPRYRHTVNPDSYSLYDTKTKKNITFDRVKDCKQYAAIILQKEMIVIPPPTPITAQDNVNNCYYKLLDAIKIMETDRIHHTPLWSIINSAAEECKTAYNKLNKN